MLRKYFLFLDDKFDGEGTYKWADGRIYEG